MKLLITHVSGDVWKTKSGKELTVFGTAEILASHNRARIIRRTFTSFANKNRYRQEMTDPWARKFASMSASFRNRGSANERFYRKHKRAEAEGKVYRPAVKVVTCRDDWFLSLVHRLNNLHTQRTREAGWDKVFSNMVTNHAKRMRAKKRNQRPCGGNGGAPSRDKNN